MLDRWLSRLKASAREEIQETARTALLYAVAGVAAIMAVILVTLAAMWWLASELGLISAALIVAGFYAVVAAVLLFWASWSNAPPAEIQAAQESLVVSEPYIGLPDMPARIGVDLGGVARTLSNSGFRAEGLVLSASSDLVRQLTPLQFVGLVFVGSFLLGRRLRRRW